MIVRVDEQGNWCLKINKHPLAKVFKYPLDDPQIKCGKDCFIGGQ